MEQDGQTYLFGEVAAPDKLRFRWFPMEEAKEQMDWGALADIARAVSETCHPVGITRIPAEIPGPAFFPAGRGLVTADLRVGKALPRGGIMVLGHNYGSVTDYKHYWQSRGEVRTNATWKMLLSFFRETEINIKLEECFFTNAFIGLLPEGSNEDSHPAHSELNFLNNCRHLIARQLEKQQPRLILTLGRFVPRFLEPLSDQLAHWCDLDSFVAIDCVGPFVPAASFDGHKASVAALVHPSKRWLNIGRRVYDNKVGHAAEIKMVSDALAAASCKQLCPKLALSKPQSGAATVGRSPLCAQVSPPKNNCYKDRMIKVGRFTHIEIAVDALNRAGRQIRAKELTKKYLSDASSTRTLGRAGAPWVAVYRALNEAARKGLVKHIGFGLYAPLGTSIRNSRGQTLK